MSTKQIILKSYSKVLLAIQYLFKVDLSYIQLVISKYPHYNDGRIRKDKPIGWSGGSYCYNGKIYINPYYKEVWKYWGGIQPNSPEEWFITIIAHELGHALDKEHHEVLPMNEITNATIDSVYLKSYEGKDPEKYMQEKIAEWVSKKVLSYVTKNNMLSEGNKMNSKNIVFYRVVDKKTNIGIYEALKQKIPIDTWNRLKHTSPINWLPKPTNNYDTTNYKVESYFTQIGFNKFMTDTMPIITKYLGKDSISILKYTSLPGEIVYKDKYQIVVKISQEEIQRNKEYQICLSVISQLTPQEQKWVMPHGRYVNSPKILYRQVISDRSDKDKGVAFVDLYPYNDSKTAFIVYAVVPQYQRKGIGTLLIASAIRWCAKNGYTKLMWRCDKDNIKSLYHARTFGFDMKEKKTCWVGIKPVSELIDQAKHIMGDMYNESYMREDSYKFKLYHLSMNPNLDGKLIKPRIPRNYVTSIGDEDTTIKRISFSTTIDGCLNGIFTIFPGTTLEDTRYQYDGGYFYVYEPDNYNFSYIENDEIIKRRLVADAIISGEVWVTSPVRFKLIGKIYVSPFDNNTAKPTVYHWLGKEDRLAIKVKFKWKWVEGGNKLSEDVWNTPKGYKDINNIIQNCNLWFEANGDKSEAICWAQHVQIRNWALELKKYRSKFGPITFERDLKELKLKPSSDNDIKMNLDKAILHAFSNWRKNKFNMEDRNRELMYCLIELREYRKKFKKQKDFSCKI